MGVGGVMNDLLVWHYWAIPHREKKRRGEERRKDGGRYELLNNAMNSINRGKGRIKAK